MNVPTWTIFLNALFLLFPFFLFANILLCFLRTNLSTLSWKTPDWPWLSCEENRWQQNSGTGRTTPVASFFTLPPSLPPSPDFHLHPSIPTSCNLCISVFCQYEEKRKCRENVMEVGADKIDHCTFWQDKARMQERHPSSTSLKKPCELLAACEQIVLNFVTCLIKHRNGSLWPLPQRTSERTYERRNAKRKSVFKIIILFFLALSSYSGFLPFHNPFYTQCQVASHIGQMLLICDQRIKTLEPSFEAGNRLIFSWMLERCCQPQQEYREKLKCSWKSRSVTDYCVRRQPGLTVTSRLQSLTMHHWDLQTIKVKLKVIQNCIDTKLGNCCRRTGGLHSRWEHSWADLQLSHPGREASSSPAGPISQVARLPNMKKWTDCLVQDLPTMAQDRYEWQPLSTTLSLPVLSPMAGTSQGTNDWKLFTKIVRSMGKRLKSKNTISSRSISKHVNTYIQTETGHKAEAI